MEHGMVDILLLYPHLLTCLCTTIYFLCWALDVQALPKRCMETREQYDAAVERAKQSIDDIMNARLAPDPDI